MVMTLKYECITKDECKLNEMYTNNKNNMCLNKEEIDKYGIKEVKEVKISEVVKIKEDIKSTIFSLKTNCIFKNKENLCLSKEECEVRE